MTYVRRIGHRDTLPFTYRGSAFLGSSMASDDSAGVVSDIDVCCIFFPWAGGRGLVGQAGPIYVRNNSDPN